MNRTSLLASVAVALAGGTWIACSFPSVSYGNGDAGADATLDVGAGDAADGGGQADVTEEPPPPDFPDANPDVVNPCDMDHDGFKAVGCDGGKDCNDYDNRVYPGQTFLPDVPNGPPDGDWNCANGVEFQYPTVACGVTSCNATGFLANPGCGKSATYVSCTGAVLCGAVDGGVRVQGCR